MRYSMVVVGLVCLQITSVSWAGDDVCGQGNAGAARMHVIAQRFAPIVLAPVQSKQAMADWILPLDFDGDFDLTNNKYAFKAAKLPRPETTSIYFSATETTSYVLINYFVYHAADHKVSTSYLNSRWTFKRHQHDGESITVLVDKSSCQMELFLSKIHGTNWPSLVWAKADDVNIDWQRLQEKINPSAYNADEFYVLRQDAGSMKKRTRRLAQQTQASIYQPESIDPVYDNRPFVMITPGSHSIYPIDHKLGMVLSKAAFMPEALPESYGSVLKKSRYDLYDSSDIQKSLYLPVGVHDEAVEHGRYKLEMFSEVMMKHGFDRDLDTGEYIPNSCFFRHKSNVRTCGPMDDGVAYRFDIPNTIATEESKKGEFASSGSYGCSQTFQGIPLMYFPLDFLHKIGLIDESGINHKTKVKEMTIRSTFDDVFDCGFHTFPSGYPYEEKYKQ